MLSALLLPDGTVDGWGRWTRTRPPAAVGAITIETEAAERRVLCLRGDVDTAVATRFANSPRRDRVVVDQFLLARPRADVRRGVGAAGRHPMLRAASSQVDRALPGEARTEPSVSI